MRHHVAQTPRSILHQLQRQQKMKGDVEALAPRSARMRFPLSYALTTRTYLLRETVRMSEEQSDALRLAVIQIIPQISIRAIPQNLRYSLWLHCNSQISQLFDGDLSVLQPFCLGYILRWRRRHRDVRGGP
jgi:hypothetical protein